MKIIENFVRPVTVAQINGELSGIGAQLIDIVQAGPESLMLYFDHIDGAADCLRLSAQRGPQGAPMLSVEYLPAEDENAQQEPAEGVQDTDLVAFYRKEDGGYTVVDNRTNYAVSGGPISLEAVKELYPGVKIVADDHEEDDDGNGLMACYNSQMEGYDVVDISTNCVVAAGPYTLEDARENWPGIQIESTENDGE